MVFRKTTLHHLTLSPDSAIEQFDTRAGAVWQEALLFPTELSGWHRTAWARHREDQDQVFVRMEWETPEAASTFVAEHCSRWVGILSNIVVEEVETHIVDLHMCFPFRGHGPTTFYQFKFSNEIPPSQRSDLLWDYNDELDGLRFNRDSRGHKGYRGADASWGNAEGTDEGGSVLYLAVTWKSYEAMERLTAIDWEENRSLERRLQPVLVACDAGWKYFNVSWGVLADYMVREWKISGDPQDLLKKGLE